MTRILYIHHGTGIGGAPLSLLGLIRGLDRTAFEPVVLCLYASEAVGLFQRAGIETYVARTSRDFSHTALDWYRLTRPRDLVRLADRLALALPTVLETRRLLVRLRPDLVHLNSSPLLYCALAARLARRPIIWHIREPLARGHLGVRRALFRRAIARLADRIIAISAYDAAQLMPSPAVRVIHNFVDFAHFDRALSGDPVRRELGIAKDAPLVGMVGGLRDVKGTPVFLAAAARVRQSAPTARFLVVGVAPEDRPALDAAARAEGLGADTLCATGVREDIPAVLAALDVLVFPSTVPHFARPVIEAGAMAKPVIASQLGGPAELVKDGATGLLVPPRDPAALAEGVLALIREPARARAMGEAGYAHAREHFDARTQVARTVAVYQELVPG